MADSKSAYLKAYNLFSAFGWMYLFALTIQTILTWESLDDFYKSKNLFAKTKTTVIFLLTTAYLEVLHAMLGFVRSNPTLVFIQMFARHIAIAGVVNNFQVTHNTASITMMNVCFCISEIIRYIYYVFDGSSLLTWCRYTFFIFLYPIGAFGEFLCYWYAVEYIKPLNVRAKYSLFLPNKLNVSFDLFYIFWGIMILYPFAFYVMYTHMCAQRKKVMNRSSTDIKKKH